MWVEVPYPACCSSNKLYRRSITFHDCKNYILSLSDAFLTQPGLSEPVWTAGFSADLPFVQGPKPHRGIGRLVGTGGVRFLEWCSVFGVIYFFALIALVMPGNLR